MGFFFRKKKANGAMIDASVSTHLGNSGAPFNRPRRNSVKFKKVAAGFGRTAFRGASRFAKTTGKYSGKGISKGHQELSGRTYRSFHKGAYSHCQKCGRPSGNYPLCKFHYNEHKLKTFKHY